MLLLAVRAFLPRSIDFRDENVEEGVIEGTVRLSLPSAHGASAAYTSK